LNYGNDMGAYVFFERLRNFTMREGQCTMHGVHCTILGEGMGLFFHQGTRQYSSIREYVDQATK